MINFAITHVNRDGLRILTLGNQRGHFPDRETAEKWLRDNLAIEFYNLRRVLTPAQVDSLRVDEVECYDHISCYASEKEARKIFTHGGCGDAKRTVFAEREEP